jgi:hypothetical protein
MTRERRETTTSKDNKPKRKKEKTKKEKRQWPIQNSAMWIDDVHLHPIDVTFAEL